MRHALAAAAMLLAAIALPPRPASAQPATPQPVTELRAIPPAMEAAFGAGNAEAMAALYDESAILLPPQGGTVQGRAALRDLYARNFAAGRHVFRATGFRVDSDSQRAVAILDWVQQISPPGRAAISLAGRTMLHLKRRGDAWVIVADMYQILPRQ
ncbi:MAG: nuclear transport factor 2 family protein [Alphaproteobacteria bacterium]|nr:nuclear transport factor 2 family protein [Alphaproteobacteria bacterium]